MNPKRILILSLLLGMLGGLLVMPGVAQTPSLDVALTAANPGTVPLIGQPVTSGVPIPQASQLLDINALRLLDENGQPVPVQFTPLARWGGAPDDTTKPIRWLLLDFQANILGDSEAYRLVNSGGAESATPTFTVTEDADAIHIDTGLAQFSISKTDGRLNAPHLNQPITGTVSDMNGTVYSTRGAVTVSLEMVGAMRAVVHVKGTYRDLDGNPLLDYTSRYWFYAGQPTVRLFHTVENNIPCPLREYAQIDCHYVGSEGSISFRDVSLVVPADLGGNLQYQTGTVNGALTNTLIVYQDSSGTDFWDKYSTLTDWDGNALDAKPRMQAYVDFRGYQTTLGGAVIDQGDQATGWLSLTGDAGTWSVGVRDFWQNFPKALRAASGTIEIGLFPVGFSNAFNLRAGEHKTHEIWLSLTPDVSPYLTPLFAQATPEWVVNSGAFGRTALPGDWTEYEEYVRYQLDTAPTYEDWFDWYPNLPTAITKTDFYGIFDYGDWPIDYEGYGVAPLNPKYDSDYGLWLQWARTGDPRWFDLAEAFDRHSADIDILHTLHSPRHWSDGIAFGHSYHDEEGFTNPHRNEGGTNPDTAYGMAGMLLTYYLTGYEKAWESALELADCIEYRLHNDYHLCDVFSDCNGEGWALPDGGMYDSGSRPVANALNIAVEAYRATGDSRYLMVADAVVNWARPEDQPYINGPTGEDILMKPWLLNMYLRALANYLDMRGEFGLPDTYLATKSYLAFADWLRTYPWLELDPIDTGARAAYPYEWWLDDRQGDITDEWAVGNNIPSINNWLALGSDAMAYAYHLSGDGDYLERAATLFRTSSRDPFFVGDANTYSATKETANAVIWGHLFLYEWTNQP